MLQPRGLTQFRRNVMTGRNQGIKIYNHKRSITRTRRVINFETLLQVLFRLPCARIRDSIISRHWTNKRQRS
jgi:cell division protein FtsB